MTVFSVVVIWIAHCVLCYSMINAEMYGKFKSLYDRSSVSMSILFGLIFGSLPFGFTFAWLMTGFAKHGFKFGWKGMIDEY